MYFGPQSAPAQSLMHALAERRLTSAATPWHCCLEFFAVSTRLPPEFRLMPADAVHGIRIESPAEFLASLKSGR